MTTPDKDSTPPVAKKATRRRRKPRKSTATAPKSASASPVASNTPKKATNKPRRAAKKAPATRTTTATTTKSVTSSQPTTATKSTPRRRRPKKTSTAPKPTAPAAKTTNPTTKRTSAPRTGARPTGPRPTSSAERRPSRPYQNRDGATLEGVLSFHPNGFGFVASLLEDDVFVPAPVLRDQPLYSGDVVLVHYSTDRRAAYDIELIKRTRQQIFGTVARSGSGLAITPDPWTGVTPVALSALQVTSAGINVGDGVLINLSGIRAVTTFGPATSPRALRIRALTRFDRGALDTIVAVKPQRDSVRRRDLRKLLTFTIDGPHSRDLDDAISVQRRGQNIALYVHIADVASHVLPGSPADVRARALGTSVYLPGYSLPMLPQELSYDQCSLLPQVTRRALTVEYVVDPKGAIVSVEVFHSTIESNSRLTYEAVADALRGTTLLPDAIQRAVVLTHEATNRLGTARAARGGVNAERASAHFDIVVDGDELHLAPPDDAAIAHDLIEEAMVGANESIANWLLARGLPGIFRTHPTPGPDAVAAVEAFAASLGITIAPGTALTPLSLAFLESQLTARAEPTTPLWAVLAPHLERATYQADVRDHFSLASSAYVHFTSPIRRYADLTVHRIITAELAGKTYSEDLVALCDHINEAAGLAARTETAARSLLWASYLSKLTDAKRRSMPARVVKVAEKGIVVALNEFGASGWILVRDLDSTGLDLDTHELSVMGIATHKTYTIAQPIQVAVDSIDVATGTVTFRLAKK